MMKQNNIAEVLLSGAVVLVGVGFLLFVYLGTIGPSLSGYDLSVEMNQPYGLKSGSDVDINGIKVGSVTDLALNRATATVHFQVQNDIKIPKDSGARAASGNVMDPSIALAIQPGRSSDTLPPGGQMVPQIRP